MAFAETRTKLSLDRWARLLGISPIQFNQVEGPKVTNTCAAHWFQFEWSSADRVSREEVARAIAMAESMIEEMIGYRLLPTFEKAEWHPTARTPKPEWLRLGSQDVRGFAQSVEAKWGYVLAGGIEGKTLIQATVPITWSDDDGDAYKETGTVTVLNVTDTACEIRAYYPGENGNETYEIRPINVSISGTTATITFRREQCVLKNLLLREYADANDSFVRPVDGANDNNFLASIDVYRVFVDASQQVELLWEPQGGCNCGTGSCDRCALGTQEGCVNVHGDPRLGNLSYRPGTWNGTGYDYACQAVARQPDLVRLWYYAGWADQSRACPTTQMDAKWERTVAYFAAALLDRPICACENIHAFIENWRQDLASVTEGGVRLSERDLNSPFGTRRGAIYAYHECLREGVRIGEVAVP